MKKLVLLSLFLLNFIAFGQNFSLINRNLIKHYKIAGSFDTIIHTIKVNNINLNGSDTLFEFEKSNFYDNFICEGNSSFYGTKVIQTVNNEFQLFPINSSDTIFIKCNSNVGTNWRFFGQENADHTNAEVISKNFETINSISDTMLRIRLTSYFSSGIIATNSFHLTNKEIVISKNYGLISGMEFIKLDGIYAKKYVEIESNYELQNNHTVFDFSIGDIFAYNKSLSYEYEVFDEWGFSYFETENIQLDKVKVKVINKTDDGENFYYTFLRKTISNNNQVIIDTVNSTIPYSDDSLFYTGKANQLLILDSIHPTNLYTVLNTKEEKFGNNFCRQFRYNNFIDLNPIDGCFSNLNDIEYYYHESLYHKNMGRTRYTKTYDSLFTYYTYSDELIYYKNDSTSFSNSFNYLYNDFSFNPNSCIGTVNFNSNNSSEYRFIWDFGDGTFSNESNPIHTYLTEGVYNVRLKLIDTLFLDTILLNSKQVNFTSNQPNQPPAFTISQGNTCGQFVFSTPDENIYWDVEGATNDSSIYVHVFNAPGTYQVTLHEILGICDFTKTKTIEIDTIGFPNLNTCPATYYVSNSKLVTFNFNNISYLNNNLFEESFMNGCLKYEININDENRFSYTFGYEYDDGFGGVFFDYVPGAIYIDFNDDGDFSLLEKISLNEFEEYDKIFELPNSNIVFNKYLRMRVSIGTGASSNHCQGDERYDFSIKLINPNAGISSLVNGNVLLYPNPTSGLLRLSSSMINKVVAIRSYEGKLINSSEYKINGNELDVSKLANGVYFLELDGNAYKFVKQ